MCSAINLIYSGYHPQTILESVILLQVLWFKICPPIFVFHCQTKWVGGVLVWILEEQELMGIQETYFSIFEMWHKWK